MDGSFFSFYVLLTTFFCIEEDLLQRYGLVDPNYRIKVIILFCRSLIGLWFVKGAYLNGNGSLYGTFW